MTRTKIVAGNWKMNTTFQEGIDLARTIAEQAKTGDHKVIMCPPATHLHAIQQLAIATGTFEVAAQNCHQKASGAFTGELSADMIKATGAQYVLIGHSERRKYFNEGHDLLKEKVDAALAAGLTPIFCCGEPLSIREDGTHVDFVNIQISESLLHLSADDFSKLVIAYEPVWAIGTGKTASPEQAQEMHQAIRNSIKKAYGQEVADSMSILYGGSVKPANAESLFSQPDVDGGLVGGASLKAETFLPIIEAI